MILIEESYEASEADQDFTLLIWLIGCCILKQRSAWPRSRWSTSTPKNEHRFHSYPPTVPTLPTSLRPLWCHTPHAVCNLVIPVFSHFTETHICDLYVSPALSYSCASANLLFGWIHLHRGLDDADQVFESISSLSCCVLLTIRDTSDSLLLQFREEPCPWTSS